MWHDGKLHLCFLLWLTPVEREGRSAAHFTLRQTCRFQILYQKLSVSEWQCSIFASLWLFISQLICYARACSSNECFILRAARLSSKLLWQGYDRERLKSSLGKFYGRYGVLVKHYEIYLSKMLHGIVEHDHIQWHPQLIRHYTNLWHYYRTWPYYRFWPNYKISGAVQRVRLGTEDAYSSGHLVLSHLGFAFVLMLRPFFPELVMSTDLLSFENTSELLFCF